MDTRSFASALLTTSALLVIMGGPAWAAVTGIDVPPGIVTRTGQAVKLSKATFDAPTIVGELEAGDTITITATKGSLSLSGIDGLAFSLGDGTDDANMSFTGTTDLVNAALDGVTYKPPTDFSGGGTVTLSVKGAATHSASLPVSINAPIDADKAREQILDGVGNIHSGVQPGFMVAYGPEAYDVAWYKGDQSNGRVTRHPVRSIRNP